MKDYKQKIMEMVEEINSAYLIEYLYHFIKGLKMRWCG